MSAKNKSKVRKDPFLRIIHLSMLGFFYAAMLIFLGINIFSSQYIPEIFFTTVQDKNKYAIFDFIARVKDLPQFQKLYPEVKLAVAENREIINKDANSRHDQITRLENLLKFNKDSPEVLYGLYLLYKADGKTAVAKDYLDRAKAIDPLIGS